jgi:hypothetical protein
MLRFFLMAFAVGRRSEGLAAPFNFAGVPFNAAMSIKMSYIRMRKSGRGGKREVPRRLILTISLVLGSKPLRADLTLKFLRMNPLPLGGLPRLGGGDDRLLDRKEHPATGCLGALARSRRSS